MVLKDSEGSDYFQFREYIQSSKVFPEYLRRAARAATFVQSDVIALQTERWVRANAEFVKSLCLYVESYNLCLLRCPLNVDRFSVTP